ncbi:hypothetical protein QPK87_01540 [Kamptonema cortianum]|nr:hypothetical protein [Geitlerinema splendidum]MDK3155271.1 hypothetical protein [Kamptonema cortianum]
MKFRKLYWVTEQVEESGNSSVRGVYTSIYDLTSKGLRWDEDAGTTGFRVTLAKLDSNCAPLGSWSAPSFSTMLEDLQPYVASGEFDAMSCEQLVKDLIAFANRKS